MERKNQKSNHSGSMNDNQNKKENRSSSEKGKRINSRKLKQKQQGPTLIHSRHNITTRSDVDRRIDDNKDRKTFSPKRAKLKIISLGGMGTITKNMMVYEYDDPLLPDGGDIVIIDVGLGFPDAEMYGIDYMIPDISYLRDRVKKIRGILITHAHEDHIGALPHIIQEIDVPIFATKLTAGLIEKKFSEYKMLANKKVSVFDTEETLRMGSFRIEPFRVAHSVPQSVGYGLFTPYGLIVHVSDFKIDETPIDDWKTDLPKIKNMCDRAGGALLLGLDSTNILEHGHSKSSKDLDEGFDEIFSRAHGRIIIAAFSSQFARMQQIFDFAMRYGRKVTILGRSMQNNAEIAFNLGFLKAPPELIINPNDLRKYPDDKVVVISTGSQAQQRSALMRMSLGEHNQIEIKKTDTVVLSASPVPGNEDAIFRMMDDLMRMGPRVIYNKIMAVHVTGHAFYDEIQQVLKLVRPKYYMPIHGDYHHLVANRDMALETGMPEDRILLVEDGEVVEADENGVRLTNRRVPVGSIMVDGSGVGDIGNIVLRDRQAMAQEGIFMVIATVNKNTGELLASPDIISRGFVYMRESNELIHGARAEIKRIISQNPEGSDWKYVKETLKNEIGNFLYRKTKRRPMVIPVVIEI